MPIFVIHVLIAFYYSCKKSPADLNGRICAGDEVVQVNQQNVVSCLPYH